MKYDIIIPHYGAGTLTRLCLRCLESIREYTEDYRLIFIDNASPEFAAVADEIEKHPHLLVRNTENLGFVKAVNQGFWMSTADWVVLLNNDTEVAPGWAEKLCEGFLVASNVGIVGPLMEVDREPSDPVFQVSRPSWQAVWQVRNGGGPYVVPKTAMVAFFCAMLSRLAIEKVGVLDESFGVGFGDDDMYCHQAHRAGFEIVLQQDLRIKHHHRSTFREIYQPSEIQSMQETALAHFRSKCQQ